MRPDGRFAPAADTWAIVPLRGLEDAKTRLAEALDPEERLELVEAMARRTLAATRDAERIAGTVLVTADPAAAELAREYGAVTIVQRLPGLNAALREARSTAVAAGAGAVLVLPIDLAAVSPGAIDEIIAATEGDPVVTGRLVAAVPDRHGHGTNALLVRPPDAIHPAFGEDSLRRHGDAAAAAGVRFVVLGGPLTLDVDTADDLLTAEAGLASERRSGDAA